MTTSDPVTSTEDVVASSHVSSSVKKSSSRRKSTMNPTPLSPHVKSMESDLISTSHTPDTSKNTISTSKRRQSAPKMPSSNPTVSSQNPSALIPSSIALDSIHLVERNGEKLRVKIIDKRVTESNSSIQYYVHYLKYDRRMDEWLPASRIKPCVEDTTDTAKDKKPPSNSPKETPIPEENSASRYLSKANDRTLTRNMKRKFDEMNIEKLSETDPSLTYLEKEREEITKIRNIHNIVFGKYSLRSWYFSPYPGEYRNLDTISVCEFCFKYMRYQESLESHKVACKHRGPPGKLVYSKAPHKIYEMDGKDHKLYCQNLCLFTKFFLDHKTVYYDIGSFKFYVLTQTERKRNKEFDHILGYFSKEKESVEGYNLACILVLPQYQKKGLGRMLIEFSYELSKLENKIGSPERPLSDLGLLGYKSYWQSVLLDTLSQNPSTQLTIRELSLLTSIRQEDIVYTLSSMDMIRYWKGDHVICITPSMIDSYVEKNGVKLERMIDPRCIVGFNVEGRLVELKEVVPPSTTEQPVKSEAIPDAEQNSKSVSSCTNAEPPS